METLIKNENELFYTAEHWISWLKIPTFNENNNNCAKIYFGILDDKKFEYCVFAGTNVGYVRDRKNIPCVDDYDIIVFDYSIKTFEEDIIPMFISIL